MSEKLMFIHELMELEHPDGKQEYLQEHMAWTIERLKARLASLAP